MTIPVPIQKVLRDIGLSASEWRAVRKVFESHPETNLLERIADLEEKLAIAREDLVLAAEAIAGLEKSIPVQWKDVRPWWFRITFARYHGKTQKEIAQLIGVSVQSVKHIRSRHGIERKSMRGIRRKKGDQA